MLRKILFLAYTFTALQAAVAQEPEAKSQGQAAEPGFKLKADFAAIEPVAGQANTKVLRAGAAEEASPVTAVQKKGGSLSADLTMMKPQIDPNASREFAAEASRRQQLMDPRRASAEMAAELARQKPVLRGNAFAAMPPMADFNRMLPNLDRMPPNFNTMVPVLARMAVPAGRKPEVPEYIPVDPESARALKAGLARPRSQLNGRILQPTAPYAGREIDAELARAKEQSSAQTVGIHSLVNAELLRAKQQTVPDIDTEVKAQLARSKPYMDAAIAAGKSELEAVFRRPATLDTDARIIGRSGSMDSTISWDRWYAGIAKLSEPRLVDALEKHHNPSGSNSILITVWSNRRLTVSLVQGHNTEFDAAILEAYGSLDGKAQLAFPTGSCRQQVSFFIDNKHNIQGAVSSVDSQPFVGDKERQRIKQ